MVAIRNMKRMNSIGRLQRNHYMPYLSIVIIDPKDDVTWSDLGQIV